MYVGRQRIVFFVGPDMCGKTEISKALSRVTDIPYFKASSEHDAFLSSRVSKRELFLSQLRYADPRVMDLLKQTGQSVIFDRGYPCEYAYSKTFGRETDEKMLRHLDEEWAKLDARIVLCCRNDYSRIVDDLDPTVKGDALQQIHYVYEEFATWTKCKLLKLSVDDENLQRELDEVHYFIYRVV
jgi:thymidylate kinase